MSEGGTSSSGAISMLSVFWIHVVVTFALIILTTAVLLGMNLEDAQSLDTRCLKVVYLVPGCAGVVHINVVRLLYRMEIRPMVSLV